MCSNKFNSCCFCSPYFGGSSQSELDINQSIDMNVSAYGTWLGGADFATNPSKGSLDKLPDIDFRLAGIRPID